MPGINLKTWLFHVIAALALAHAALAAPTTPPPAEGSGQVTTTDALAQAMDTVSMSSVPTFQCAASRDSTSYARSVSALFAGLMYVSNFITEVCIALATYSGLASTTHHYYVYLVSYMHVG